MAKDQKKTKRTRSFDDELREASVDELAADLGLDELTYDSCVRELFGDLLVEVFGEQDPGPAPPEGSGGRIIQMGPGWRTPPEEKDF